MKKYFVITFLLFTKISLAQSPLPIPPLLSGTNFNLTIQNGVTQFYPGINTPTYGINGNLLAPTLLFKKGDVVTLNVTNTLTGNGNATTIHWHGLHVPASADGGPHQLINQGTTWQPSFKVLNNAATFWYHPHGMNKTDLHVAKGIAGLIIVKDTIESKINLPRTYGVDDFPIIIQTKDFDILHQIAISTQTDTAHMVNGVVNPYLDAPSQVIRLRLLNGSSGRTFMLGFSNNMNFHLIATDGGLLDSSQSMNRIQLSNGERAEILVDFSMFSGGNIYLKNFGSELAHGIQGADSVGDNSINFIPDYYTNPLNGSDYDLLKINFTAPTSSPVITIPAALTPLSVIPISSATFNRNFVFDTITEMGNVPNFAAGPFAINQKLFEMDSINETVYLNTTETWTLINRTMVAHPFHIHDVEFLIVDINGKLPPAYEKGWKDVVLVMPGDTIRFITKFEDFADDHIPYMYHCHVLHHEDDGMMGSFIVIDTTKNGVHELTRNTDGISIYPNPCNDELRITMDELRWKNSKLEVIDLLGHVLVMKEVFEIKNSSINIHNLSNGIYFLKITSNNNIITKKFEKE
jgi:bilirubin oxidase